MLKFFERLYCPENEPPIEDFVIDNEIFIPITDSEFNLREVKDAYNQQKKGYNFTRSTLEPVKAIPFHIVLILFNIIFYAANVITWAPNMLCTIPKKGNLALKKGNLTLKKGNLTLKKGNLTLKKGNLTLKKGNLTLKKGNLTLKKGNQTLPKNWRGIQLCEYFKGWYDRILSNTHT